MNVPAGTYTGVQTASVPGRELNQASYTVQVGLSVPGVVYSVSDVKNMRILGSVTLVKKAEGTAADDAGLNDALFTLEWEDVSGAWEPVGTFLTGKSYAAPDPALAKPAADDGTLSIAGLGWGTYRLTETKAPVGYALGATPAAFAFKVGPDNDRDVRLTWDFGAIENARAVAPLARTGDPFA